MTGARILAWALLALVTALATPVRAEPEGRIGAVTARMERGVVTVSATLEGGFPREVVEQIRRGVPKDLFYTVTVRRRHRRFFDEEVTAATVRYTIKYDTLDGWYHLRHVQPGGHVTERKVPSYAEALEIVARVDGVPLVVPPTAYPGTLYAAVKAEMRAVRQPFYLDYVFFFIPVLAFETPWARSANLEPRP
ncbi:MAG: DUF4390 domain-containing protein [Nitrospirae bacterium]|nr:DUF4390 domain-containing protein [Nitrospirota bacterium]